MLTNEQIGQRIKARRKELAMTLQEVADDVGVQNSTISRYELGLIKKIKLPVIDAIAATLQVNPAWLLGKTDDPTDYEDGDLLAEIPSNYLELFQGDAKKAIQYMHAVDEDALSEKRPPNISPSYSGEALKLAKDYDGLDKWGKQAVRDVADTEMARVEDESRFFQSTDVEQEPKVINLFLEPAAAGIATPLVGQDYEPYELKPGDPPGAAFAIRIQGDSMEPYFPDGSTAFVNRDALVDGDIGVFCVDGGTVCKQYHYDRVLGITYLFSLNRKRADCDVVITRDSNQSLVCQGRIMTKKRFPLPEL